MPAHRALIVAALTCLAAQRADASGAVRVSVWRDPHCGCCTAWVAHLRAEGFVVQDQVVPSVTPVRRRLGTPPDLLSCHAGEVEGFVLEGHVPAEAIRRLLAQRPPGVRGLAARAMPIGSPGMEVPGAAPDTYDVVAFGAGGHRSFMRFTGNRSA